ncbi:MAG: hypothetical protein NT043_05840 [Candidatus Bathyarchaeota archaeon]|nr:hypothetical protein [Candidatus Bathyarchaeota archaeon]
MWLSDQKWFRFNLIYCPWFNGLSACLQKQTEEGYLTVTILERSDSGFPDHWHAVQSG